MKTPKIRSDTSPIECAGGFVLDHGRVLLGLRAPDANTYPCVWDMFGGHVEDGETIEATLIRELSEELDITPSEFDFLTTLTEPDPQSNGNYLYHIYTVTAWSGGGPRRCGHEHTEIRWCTLDEALALNLGMPEYRSLLQKIMI